MKPASKRLWAFCVLKYGSYNIVSSILLLVYKLLPLRPNSP